MTHKVTKPIALDESFRTTEQNPQNIADVLANKLDAIKSAIENGGSGEMEAAFECHYNVTSATDIYNAMQDKKVPFFYQNGVVAQLWKVETNKYTFRTTSTRVVEGENILDIVDYIVNGSVWSTATKTISGGSSSQQAYLAKVESSVNFDTTGLSGMQSIISVNDVPADGVYQLSIFMCITPKTASATKSDLVFQFTGTSGTGMPNTTFHAVVDDSQTFAQQLSFSTTLNLKAGTNSLKMACDGLNTEYLVFVDNLTVAQLVNGVYHNGDTFEEVNDLTEASDFNADDELLVVSPNSTRKMLWTTLANKVLGFIKSLPTTITSFRSGDYIPVDGPSGTAKMSNDDLLAVTAAYANSHNSETIAGTGKYAGCDNLPNYGSFVIATRSFANCPTASWIGIVLCYGITNYCVQVAYSLDADKKIYFRRSYNGTYSAWTELPKKEYVDTLLLTLVDKIVTPSFTSGHFVRYSDGSVRDLDSYSMSSPITLGAYQSISVLLNGTINYVSVISQYDNGAYVPLVVSTSDDAVNYKYTNKTSSDIQVVLSCDNSNLPEVCAIINEEYAEEIDDLVDLIFDSVLSPSFTIGHFVRANGTVAEASGWYMSENITLKPGAKITAYASGYGRNVSILAAYNGAGVNYTPLIVSTDNVNRKFVYTNKTGKTLLVCISTSIVPKEVYIEDSEDSDDFEIVSLSHFEKIGVIGDSYASGAIYKNGSLDRLAYEISWPQVLARKVGATAVNFSTAGLTTRSWLTSGAGLSKLNSEPAQDLYIIALGINDAWSLGLEYIGSVEDIGTDADTFYGNMAKIVSAIQTKSAGARIVISTLANDTTGNSPQYNVAIRTISSVLGIPCIEQKDDPFFATNVYTAMDNNHPTKMGYAGMANAMCRMIEAAMSINLAYFNHVE